MNKAKEIDLKILTKMLWVSLLILIFWAIGLNLLNYYVPKFIIISIGLVFTLSFGVYTFLTGAFLYCLKRFLEAFITVFIIATLTFMLLRLIPGGPFDQEKALPPEIKANIEVKYGLDKPLLVQYLDYLKKVSVFDFGTSYKYIGRSVGDMILQNFAASFVLGFYAFILSFLIGIPVGLFAASRHNTFWDNLAMAFSISGVALPNFLVGSVLILLFSYQLNWFPPALWDSSWHYFLPVVTLGVRPAAFIARLTRSTVLDVIQSDFIRTAKAKGLSQFKILYKHVLKKLLNTCFNLLRASFGRNFVRFICN